MEKLVPFAIITFHHHAKLLRLLCGAEQRDFFQGWPKKLWLLIGGYYRGKVSLKNWWLVNPKKPQGHVIIWLSFTFNKLKRILEFGKRWENKWIQFLQTDHEFTLKFFEVDKMNCSLLCYFKDNYFAPHCFFFGFFAWRQNAMLQKKRFNNPQLHCDQPIGG